MKGLKLLVFGLPMLFLACQPQTDNESTANCETDTVYVHDFDYVPLTIEAPDSVKIAANEYKIDDTSPIIVLCHQAQFNKFEYDGIAQRLNEMGFNCIAIDQRSGGPIGSTQNLTNLDAQKAGKAVSYLDAQQDITAAVNFTAERYQQEVILWGSSYSSTLVLWESLKNENIRAVVSFSPGDYFEELGSLTDQLPQLSIPFFITSGGWEAEATTQLLSKTELGANQIQFIPEGDGHHGSRALWPNQSGGEEYWEAVTDFLNQLK